MNRKWFKIIACVFLMITIMGMISCKNDAALKVEISTRENSDKSRTIVMTGTDDYSIVYTMDSSVPNTVNDGVQTFLYDDSNEKDVKRRTFAKSEEYALALKTIKAILVSKQQSQEIAGDEVVVDPSTTENPLYEVTSSDGWYSLDITLSADKDYAGYTCYYTIDGSDPSKTNHAGTITASKGLHIDAPIYSLKIVSFKNEAAPSDIQNLRIRKLDSLVMSVEEVYGGRILHIKNNDYAIGGFSYAVGGSTLSEDSKRVSLENWDSGSTYLQKMVADDGVTAEVKVEKQGIIPKAGDALLYLNPGKQTIAVPQVLMLKSPQYSASEMLGGYTVTLASVNGLSDTQILYGFGSERQTSPSTVYGTPLTLYREGEFSAFEKKKGYVSSYVTYQSVRFATHTKALASYSFSGLDMVAKLERQDAASQVYYQFDDGSGGDVNVGNLTGWTNTEGDVANLPVTGTPRLRVLTLAQGYNHYQEFSVTQLNKPEVTVKKILGGLEIGVACDSSQAHVLKVDADTGSYGTHSDPFSKEFLVADDSIIFKAYAFPSDTTTSWIRPSIEKSANVSLDKLAVPSISVSNVVGGKQFVFNSANASEYHYNVGLDTEPSGPTLTTYQYKDGKYLEDMSAAGLVSASSVTSYVRVIACGIGYAVSDEGTDNEVVNRLPTPTLTLPNNAYDVSTRYYSLSISSSLASPNYAIGKAESTSTISTWQKYDSAQVDMTGAGYSYSAKVLSDSANKGYADSLPSGKVHSCVTSNWFKSGDTAYEYGKVSQGSQSEALATVSDLNNASSIYQGWSLPTEAVAAAMAGSMGDLNDYFRTSTGTTVTNAAGISSTVDASDATCFYCPVRKLGN